MNEYEHDKQDRKLEGNRDKWIAVALAGVAGILLFGILASGDPEDRAAWIMSAIAFGSALLAMRLGKSLGEHRGTRRFAADDSGVSPVIAVILMVAITVVLAATVFVLVQDIGGNVQQPTPAIGWSQDTTAKTLMVNSIPTGHQWNDFKVVGCTAPDGNDTVDPGDKLTDCAGDVQVTYLPSNSLVYVTKF